MGDVEFIGWASDDALTELYRGARGLLYPGEEDFGIVPVEAMAAGCPVIAFGRGGVLETVGRGASAEATAAIASGREARVAGGVLFGTQSADGLARAIEVNERVPSDRDTVRAQAAPFSAERFDSEFRAAFDRAVSDSRARGARA